jgi:uncharacterized protein DUF2336
MSSSGTLDENKLLELANAKHIEETVAALSILCSVPIKIAEQLFFSKYAEPLLILCRSTSFKWPTVRAVIEARPPSITVAFLL